MPVFLRNWLKRIFSPLYLRMLDSVREETGKDVAARAQNMLVRLREETRKDLETHVHNIHLHHLEFHDQLTQKIGDEIVRMRAEIDAIRDLKDSRVYQLLEQIQGSMQGKSSDGAGPAIAREFQKVSLQLEEIRKILEDKR